MIKSAKQHESNGRTDVTTSNGSNRQKKGKK